MNKQQTATVPATAVSSSFSVH
jgi:hypothetical protein